MNKNNRIIFFVFLIIGSILTLVGTAMSSEIGLGIVNVINVSGIALLFLSKRLLRLQEDHVFINKNKSPVEWLILKRNTGIIFCVIGIILAIIATTQPTTMVIFGMITTNIAIVCGICVFLLGAGKIGKKKMLTNHNAFVIRVMGKYGYPNELIVRARSMNGLRV